MTEGIAMGRSEAFSAPCVWRPMRLQTLSVPTRTGNNMNAVREGLNPVGDKGARPTAVNDRHRSLLGFAGILAFLCSSCHLN